MLVSAGLIRYHARKVTTLLLVEDDPDMREPLQLLLEHAGYRVIVAEDGAAALTAMGSLRPRCRGH